MFIFNLTIFTMAVAVLLLLVLAMVIYCKTDLFIDWDEIWEFFQGLDTTPEIAAWAFTLLLGFMFELLVGAYWVGGRAPNVSLLPALFVISGTIFGLFMFFHFRLTLLLTRDLKRIKHEAELEQNIS